jgi:hypothetical protein
MNEFKDEKINFASLIPSFPSFLIQIKSTIRNEIII